MGCSATPYVICCFVYLLVPYFLMLNIVSIHTLLLSV